MHRGVRSLFLPTLSVVAVVWSIVAQCQTPTVVPNPGEIFRDCPDCPEMVVVPPGDFNMGSLDTPYEKPEHKVTIAQPLAIGRREVTFDEWDQCVAALAWSTDPTIAVGGAAPGR